MELIRLNKTNLHRISELNRLFFLFCCTHDNAPSGEIAGETEERNKELGTILFDAQEADECNEYRKMLCEIGFTEFYKTADKILDFLYKNHFDVHGLIPKGLALETLEGMYNS